MKIGEKLFAARCHFEDDECGCGHIETSLTLEEALEFIAGSEDNWIYTSGKRTTIFEDGEWVVNKLDALDLAKKEWEQIIQSNPDCAEALHGVGL